MIMRISDGGDEDFFGDGIQPLNDVQNLYRPEIANWRFVTLQPVQRQLRSDAGHSRSQPAAPHLHRTGNRRPSAIPVCPDELYFG